MPPIEIIVADEKHGSFTYLSAADLLQQRVDDGYWYDNWDDGNPRHQWEDRARLVVGIEKDHPGREQAAWRFLLERCDHEYEYVEKQTVR